MALFLLHLFWITEDTEKHFLLALASEQGPS